jgi:hypothetical protein
VVTLPHPSREAFLASRLSELAGYWLEIRCACNLLVYYPCRLLAKERGASLVVGEVLPRLRCKKCRGAPTAVLATDDPSGGGQGGSA